MAEQQKDLYGWLYLALIVFAVGVWLWHGGAWLWDHFSEWRSEVTEGKVETVIGAGCFVIGACISAQWMKFGRCSRSWWSLALVPVYFFGGGVDVLAYLVFGEFLMWYKGYLLNVGSPTFMNWVAAVVIAFWLLAYLLPRRFWEDAEEEGDTPRPVQ